MEQEKRKTQQKGSNIFLKWGWRFMIASMILYFAENLFFGMNWIAQSSLEKQVDLLVAILFNIGVLMFFIPGIQMYEYLIHKHMPSNIKEEEEDNENS